MESTLVAHQEIARDVINELLPHTGKAVRLGITGVPGAGKSTVGVLLAKALKMPFIDTDLLIQRQEDSYLQELIDTRGIDAFIQIEENIILSLDVRNNVIATGGSVIYSESAIEHLRANGILVLLDTKMYQLERRLKNTQTRGIAMKGHQSLASLYNERMPLYRKYADLIIDCSKKHIDTIVLEIKEKVNCFKYKKFL